jgi:hypothetical protein
MIPKDIFNKNEICYAFLTSYNEPNVLIPVKGIIKDIRFKQDFPTYLIEITKFYDNVMFLRNYLINMTFYKTLDSISTFFLKLPDFKSIGELQAFIDANEVTVVVHGIFTFSKKQNLVKYFNKMNDYNIHLNLLALQNNITRSFYSGDLRISNKLEFAKRLEKFFGDKFPTETGLTFKKLMRDIFDAKPISKLKSKHKKNRTLKYLPKI